MMNEYLKTSLTDMRSDGQGFSTEAKYQSICLSSIHRGWIFRGCGLDKGVHPLQYCECSIVFCVLRYDDPEIIFSAVVCALHADLPLHNDPHHVHPAPVINPTQSNVKHNPDPSLLFSYNTPKRKIMPLSEVCPSLDDLPLPWVGIVSQSGVSRANRSWTEALVPDTNFRSPTSRAISLAGGERCWNQKP